MAKAKELPKPLFPLKHDFISSLDRYIHTAGMVADSLRTVLNHPGNGLKDGVADMLREQLKEFDDARGL